MAQDDPLDKVTSISAELKDNGVVAKSNSRAVNAIDRLVGNLADWVNVRMESDTVIRRITNESTRRLIEVATEVGIERLKTDPDFAERAINNYVGKIFQKQVNREAVAVEAIDQLRLEPPTEAQAEAGAETIDAATMDRIEHYAEFASSDELRQRWGKVLAAEIRQPGTFSQKVLRIVDELDARTAADFEALVVHRIGDIVPLGLSGELDHDQRTRLILAGLLVDPGFTGKILKGGKVKRSDGAEIVIFGILRPRVFGFEKPATYRSDNVLSNHEDAPAIKVHMLTDAGSAIASILPDRQSDAYTRLVATIAEEIVPAEVDEYIEFGGQLKFIGRVKAPAQQ